VNTIAESSLETIAVDQCHKKLKLFLFTVVRRGRHQQEVTGQRRKQLSEFMAFGKLYFATEK
jgi:hypothetical protein